jgi:hypothetical protein
MANQHTDQKFLLTKIPIPQMGKDELEKWIIDRWDLCTGKIPQLLFQVLLFRFRCSLVFTEKGR